MLLILQLKYLYIYIIVVMYVSKFVIIKYYICLYKALFSYTIKNGTKRPTFFNISHQAEYELNIT